MRKLILILGDQLWHANPALRTLDPNSDTVVMIEAPGESSHVWSSKPRTAMFLSAMRHFAQELRAAKVPLIYVGLGDDADRPALIDRLENVIVQHQPELLVVTQPGEYRLLVALQKLCAKLKLALDIKEDTHFLSTPDEFARWAAKYKQLRMEFFYRVMRAKHGVLMQGDEPEGGQWNYDAENRQGFPKSGPGNIPAPAHFAPDAITREVFADINALLPDHPGALDDFAWPVTRAQALHALDQFIKTRLPQFGPYQDAMWTNTPFGWHSMISAALNLHLLDPREVIAAAETAYRNGGVPLPSVEGFIRQILGWREFIRGVYWLHMPQMREANHFKHTRKLPGWYWTGQTGMACMRDTIGQTLRYGYAHHIQRLMVTGQFGILAELDPAQVSDWYLAVYVDAVEWAELPNVAGMALYADGGRFTSKPYIASGQYIKRMSNYCAGCQYKPEKRTGSDACPVSTLYWNFLDKHEAALTKNPRTVLMAKSVGRLEEAERQAIRDQARQTLDNLDSL